MEIEKIVNLIKTKQKIGKQIFDELISAYTLDNISDEEILPVIQAIYKYDICDEDLFYLTDAMKNSGQTLDLSSLGQVVDKHSTGGVSDTTTIILVPICATLGTKMLKLSGRSLGFTGGTCDKLEAFSGYKTDIDIPSAIELTKQNGGCMLTSSLSLAPADKKIYALRDKTGLVDNVSLIASSVMSKKLASGANIIVLDVKYGNGAFMPTKYMAKRLGKKMKKIGTLAGKKVKVVYGNMNQPLGYNIGSKLETMEAIRVLSGKEKGNLYKESVKLASICVALDKHISTSKAKRMVEDVINNGSALEKLKTMVKAQGGSDELFSEEYPTSTFVIRSPFMGKVCYYKTKDIGKLANNIEKSSLSEFAKTSKNKKNTNKQKTPCYGIITTKKLGDKVSINEPLFYVYAKDEKDKLEIQYKLLSSIIIK